jgi:hypothetical protein
VYDEVAQNKRRSTVLIAVFVIFTTAVVWAALRLMGATGIGIVGIAAVVAIGTAWLAYWKSDEVALRMSRAVEADPVTYAPACTTWSRGCASPRACPSPGST